ncbi:MAG: His/Gly/Thr/Pro-type tRNA ligase C-terminal domain-containing protein, partial [Erysipelotrichaceae bacterium]
HARVGFAGPIGLEIPVIMDREVSHMRNFICGANKNDAHFTNVNLRDFKVSEVGDIAAVCEGDVCPNCGQPLVFTKGIEVGNTFKLGNKYAKSLGLEYLDQDNKLIPVEMGSYGIGLERCMAAIVEQHNDEHGIVWPKSVAPFDLGIVVANQKDEEQARVASELYDTLRKQYDVLLDDRKERAGVKFKDMELIGLPLRITVGKRAVEGIVEVRGRQANETLEVSINDLNAYLEKVL